MSTPRRRRRGQGEGTIYQIAPGRWRAELFVGWVDGRRRKKVTTRKTRREAALWLNEQLKHQQDGTLVTTRSTLSEWFETYLREVAAPRVRSSTLSSYRGDFERHIKPTLGKVPLDRLKPAHLSRLYQQKLDQGLSPATVRLIHATLRRALNVAFRWGLVSRNVALMVDPPSREQTEVVPLSVAEARQLLRAAKGDRMEARWVVGLSLGLRQGEVLGLWWEDVDFEAATLRVRRSLLRARVDDERLAFGALKSARSRRTLSLPRPVLDALKGHKARQAEERLKVGEAWQDERIIFSTVIGTPTDPSNDAKTFRALLDRAGIRRVRLHDLRHTAASLLLAQGMHARVVMEVLGHSQIALTMNTYSHVMPSLLEEAARSMEQALWGEAE